MIHPSATFEHAATPPPGTAVMTSDCLPQFRDAFVALCLSVSRLNRFGSAKEVTELLANHHLLPDGIIAKYARQATKASKA